jgi:hypothetical protein
MQLLTCEVCGEKLLHIYDFESLLMLMKEAQADGEVPDFHYSKKTKPENCPHCLHRGMWETDEDYGSDIVKYLQTIRSPQEE